MRKSFNAAAATTATANTAPRWFAVHTNKGEVAVLATSHKHARHLALARLGADAEMVMRANGAPASHHISPGNARRINHERATSAWKRLDERVTALVHRLAEAGDPDGVTLSACNLLSAGSRLFRRVKTGNIPGLLPEEEAAVKLAPRRHQGAAALAARLLRRQAAVDAAVAISAVVAELRPWADAAESALCRSVSERVMRDAAEKREAKATRDAARRQEAARVQRAAAEAAVAEAKAAAAAEAADEDAAYAASMAAIFALYE